VSNRRPPDEGPESITRRKFTLSERLDREIEQLASRHYQGNVSLCLRAAIKEHQRTLDGEGRLALKRLEREVNHLSEAVAELDHDTADLAAEIEGAGDSPSLGAPPSVEDRQFDVAQRLLDEFLGAETPLRVEDLVERSDLPTRRIVRALGQLVNLGSIVETSSNSRYQLVANDPERAIEQGHD
jgi:hypothetical protein